MLEKVHIGTKLALQEANPTAAEFEAVCKDCLKNLSRIVSHGAKLLADKKEKEAQRQELWKSRTNFVRQGRALMKQKALSQAAVCYEKYLRILEIILRAENGGLTPEILRREGRGKEITVVTSVYWDLLRIYDISHQYQERQQRVAEKLALFSPHSAAYRDVVKRAEEFAKRAKNKTAVEHFLRQMRLSRPRCFIATAVFCEPASPEILSLTQFRDQVLRHSPGGRRFIYWYYRWSPTLAQLIERTPLLRSALRPLLRLLASRLARRFNLPTRSEF